MIECKQPGFQQERFCRHKFFHFEESEVALLNLYLWYNVGNLAFNRIGFAVINLFISEKAKLLSNSKFQDILIL